MDIQNIGSVSGVSLQQNSNGPAVATAPAGKLPDQAVPAAPAATQAVDANQLKHAVDNVNAVIQTMNKDLFFSIDQSTGIHVVKVVDTSTQEVIRQFPSKEVLAIAKSIDQLQGLLVKDKA